jgi:hypothetical protein
MLTISLLGERLQKKTRSLLAGGEWKEGQLETRNEERVYFSPAGKSCLHVGRYFHFTKNTSGPWSYFALVIKKRNRNSLRCGWFSPRSENTISGVQRTETSHLNNALIPN